MDNNESSKDDGCTEGFNYQKELDHAKSYLPFLNEIIKSSESLGIRKEYLTKLQSLYEMVDQKPLSSSKLKSCQSVIYGLYDKYHSILTKDQIQMLNDSKKLNELDGEEKIIKSSEEKLTSNKSDLEQQSKSDIPSKIFSSTNSVANKTQIDNLEQNNKLLAKKSSWKMINDESTSSSKNNDSLHIKNLPEFAESRLRLNKVIGFATSASIEKLSNSDTLESHVNLAQQIYDELPTQDMNKIFCVEMLKDINMDDIDVDHVKKVIDGIKNSVEPVKPPPFPPPDLLSLEAESCESPPTIENKASCEIQSNAIPTVPTSSLVPSKSISIREKLNSDINVLHKIGSSHEPKQKFISVLKPGTLIDLENSKVRNPLYMEPILPITKSIEKNAHVKPFVPDIGAPRDPRIRKKSFSNPENSFKSSSQANIQTSVQQQILPAPPTSNFQNPSLVIPSLLSLNIGTQKELSNNGPMHFQSSSSHVNMQLFNQQFPVDHQSKFKNYRPLTNNLYRNDHNDFTLSVKKHDFVHHPNNNQTNINSAYHYEETSRYRELVTSNSHRKQINQISPRDPRYIKSDPKIHEPQSYKEFREAKYGKEKNSYKGFAKNIKQTNQHDHNHGVIQENEKLKSINKSRTDGKNNPYNSFGVINNSASMKSFKIPKIKRKEDVIENTKDKNDENNLKIETNEVNDSEKGSCIETVKDNSSETELVNIEHQELNLETSNVSEVSIANETEINIIQTKNNTLKKNVCKPKKIKKYSKEKEFEKIVKQAVESSNDDVCGPRTRTRSSLLKKEKTKKIINFNNSPKKDNSTNNDESFMFGECSKSLNIKSLNTENCVESIEIGHNVISSTSKELSEVDSLIESSMCNSHEKNVVSSSEINSTADITSDLTNNENSLMKIFKNETFIKTFIKVLKDTKQIETLQKYLDENDGVDESENVSKLDKGLTDVDEPKTCTTQISTKEGKEDKKIQENSTEEELIECINEENKNESYNHISNNVNKESMVLTEKVISYSVNSNDDVKISSIGNQDNLSVNQVQLKTQNGNKDESSEILKDKCKVEVKNLKIVIPKYDKDIKRNDDQSSVLESSNDEQVPQKLNKEETIKKHKPKKPLVGPKSVKLARKKMEKQNCTSNDLQEKSQPEFETSKTVITIKNLTKSMKNGKRRNKEDIPYVVIKSSSGSSTDSSTPKISVEIPNQDERDIEKHSNKITLKKDNVIEKSEVKKTRSKMTELDKLHADINENCAAVVNVPNIRHCRTNKQIDYVNTNKTSSVEQFSVNKESLQDLEKPTKKQCKKSTCKLNKNKHTVKQNCAKKEAVQHKAVKASNVNINKKLNAAQQTGKLKTKKKSKGYKKNKKLKKLKNLTKGVSVKTSQLNNSSNNDITTEVTTKVLTVNEFIDKSYFQNADNILDCKFCHYHNTGLNIVRHYIEQHHGEEVLPSRLSKICAEILMNESFRNNYGYSSSDDSKTLCCTSNGFMCIFCQIVVHDITDFYDHITGHTGEYRYKCKMCKQMYSTKNEFESHILVHAEYEKTDENLQKLPPNSIQNNRLFGYLCSFCYYTQLDYNNIVKHMTLRHFNEDKKFNGHWTVIRISMSVGDDNYDNSIIDYTNLVGCLPPMQYEQQADQTFSKDIDNIDIPSQEYYQANHFEISQEEEKECFRSVKKEYNDKQEVDEESSTFSIHQMSSKQSNSPSHKRQSRITENESDIDYPDYTLKDNSVKCATAGLSCESINSLLVFKCTASVCQNAPYSSVVLVDFFKHINLIHRYLVWDNKCDTCKHKIEKISEQQFLKDALEHLISNHLVIKESKLSNMSNLTSIKKEQDMDIRYLCTIDNSEKKQSSNTPCQDTSDNGETLETKQSSSTLCQDIVKNEKTEKTPVMQLRVRNLPGDILSVVHQTAVNEELAKESVIDNSKQSSDIVPNIPLETSDQTDVNEELAKEIVIDNSKQSSDILPNIPFETSVDQINLNEVTNIESSSLLVPPNRVVKNVKEKKVKKRKTSCTNKTQFWNNDDRMLDIWSSIETQLEVVFKNPNLPIESGQQIINNGTPVHGTYCLINTEYKKDYAKKLRELPMDMMKTRLAFKDMTDLPKLFGLFKCLDRTCTKVFNIKESFILHMRLHFENPEKKRKNNNYNPEQFKKCVYCLRQFDNEESIATHIVEKHIFCDYFCPFCFYRAYSPSHVVVHQSLIHNKLLVPRVIKLERSESICENRKEILLAVDYNEFVLPYSCSVGCCNFSCYVAINFISHLSQEHQQCDKFCCYICSRNDEGEGFLTLQPRLMIPHFKLHNINVYQCIFCLFGSDQVDAMMSHLAMEHFEYQPMCLERSLYSNNYAIDEIDNLKIIRISKNLDGVLMQNSKSLLTSLPKFPTQKNKKKCSPDVLSTAMKSAHIDNQSSDAIVITVPDGAQMTASTSLNAPSIDNNEFIMLDDNMNQNDIQETLNINQILITETETVNSEWQSRQLNDDVIIIDDDDDEDILLDTNTSNKEKNSEIPIKRKHSTKHSVKESLDWSNKVKRLALPVIPLAKLFTCKECNRVFSNSKEYQAHLSICPFWNSNGQLCVFCSKPFKTPSHMTEHLKLHGPDRFICSICNFIVPSVRAIAHHMKVEHNIINLDYVPTISELTDMEHDKFIVYEDKTVIQDETEIIGNYKIGNLQSKNIGTIEAKMRNVEFEITPQQPTSLKRKRSNHTNVGNKKASPKANNTTQVKTKTLLFSPDTIERIPLHHIFSEQVGCLLCSYVTKVRSNLVQHLEGHKRGQDNTTKEIVNPVPSIGKSELMFDKMINLSASSFDAMHSEKVKINEINLKIVEVAPREKLNMGLFPQFIPRDERFKCSITSCNFIAMTLDGIKLHLSVIHDCQTYVCPHCPINCTLAKEVELNLIDFHLMHHSENLYGCGYCDYIDFNRNEMRGHMRNAHMLQITSTNQSNIIVIRQSMLEDSITERSRNNAQTTAAHWVCKICSSGIKYTENEIISHIYIAHNLSNMFKCPMCEFEHNDDNAKVFEDHYKSRHPSVAVKCLKVFEKITDVRDLHKQSIQTLVPSYNLEQQALESIEPTLVVPTCRGIPIETIPNNKTPNKYRGVPKSPKSIAKNTPVKARNQKMLTDSFSMDDSLGTISSRGLFVCPKCNVFETMNAVHFRDHLYKDVNYRTWKCMKCEEISDSPKKMAWHVKKHGNGSKYERIENNDKLEWVSRVINHQNSLLIDFKNKEKKQKIIENNKAIHKKPLGCSPLKRKRYNNNEKIESVPPPPATLPFDGEIINLLDSDDE